MHGLLYYIFKLSPKLAFNIEYKLVLKAVSMNSHNLFSFPMIIFLEFEKDDIYKRFLKGKSVYSQVKFRAATIARRLTREPSEETLRRYNQFRQYILNKREEEREQAQINDFISKFPEFKANAHENTSE